MSDAGGGMQDLFALTRALRGRSPNGPPPPRVLDVLVFGRAQARFLGTASAAGAVALPWRDPALDAAPRDEPAAGDAAPGMTGTTEAPPPSPTARAADRGAATPAPFTPPAPAVPAPARAAQPPGAPDRAGEPLPQRLHFTAPAVPALALQPSSAAASRDEHRAGPADPPPAAPVEARARPFASPPAVGLAGLADARQPERAGVRPAARPLGAREAPASAPRPSPHVPPLPHLPWLDRRIDGQGAPAPAGRSGWPFAPTPTRSAVVVAERVARAVGRADAPRARPDAVDPGLAAAPARRGRPPAEAATASTLAPGVLLREVTRDEVVRALAERMRALAREDRFRLGELR